MTKRLHYKLVKFETSDYIWPVELLSAVLGLCGILFVSFLLIKKSCLSYVNGLIGFSAVRSDISDILEESFQNLQQQDKEYYEDDYKENVGEEGYATEDISADTSKEVNVEDIIEAKIRKNQQLFPVPPSKENNKNEVEIELTTTAENSEEKKEADEEKVAESEEPEKQEEKVEKKDDENEK